MTRVKIMDAIAYALRREPVTEDVESEEGGFLAEITEPESLERFVMVLLEELGVAR